MANFEDVKQQVNEAAGFVVEKSKEYAKLAYEKAKVAGKIAKLSAEIAGEKDKIKKAQLELGKKYYDICKENPAEPLKAECDIITYALDAIKTKIEELKKAEPEAEEADFEETAEACAQEEKEEPADEDEPETEDKSEE